MWRKTRPTKYCHAGHFNWIKQILTQNFRTIVTTKTSIEGLKSRVALSKWPKKGAWLLKKGAKKWQCWKRGEEVEKGGKSLKRGKGPLCPKGYYDNIKSTKIEFIICYQCFPLMFGRSFVPTRKIYFQYLL